MRASFWGYCASDVTLQKCKKNTERNARLFLYCAADFHSQNVQKTGRNARVFLNACLFVGTVPPSVSPKMFKKKGGMLVFFWDL